ncbi:MAG: hypothetical protein HUK04_04140 [Bacteroidaceae bacterium]|nr:hypothetical protein [Bacteroidaceae bacterium]MCF0188663.1 hypothetical protein [Bacteroidaceae bacterium]
MEAKTPVKNYQVESLREALTELAKVDASAAREVRMMVHDERLDSILTAMDEHEYSLCQG